MTIASNLTTATPDERYARGVPMGALAELMGLGSDGVHWRQVMVILVGTWMAAGASPLQWVPAPDSPDPMAVVLLVVFPPLFLFAAITAIRSFQGAPAVVLSGASLYSLLVTAVRVAAMPDPATLDVSNYWLRAGIADFTWMALTFSALQFAVAKRLQWAQMAGALLIASFAQSIVVARLFFDTPGSEQLADVLVFRVASRGFSVLSWTFAFWLGLRLRRDHVTTSFAATRPGEVSTSVFGRGVPALATPSAADPGLLSRLLGVFVAPRSAFAAVVAKPQIMGPLVVTTSCLVVISMALVATERGKAMSLRAQVRQIESSGRVVTEEMYAELRARQPYEPYILGATQLIVVPISLAVLGGLLTSVFSTLLGGSATHRQVYAVMAHAYIIVVVQQVVIVGLTFLRGDVTGVNLQLIAPSLEEAGAASRVLRSIDLFALWWIATLAVGLGVLYKRDAVSIAASLIAVYLLLAVSLEFLRPAL